MIIGLLSFRLKIDLSPQPLISLTIDSFFSDVDWKRNEDEGLFSCQAAFEEAEIPLDKVEI